MIGPGWSARRSGLAESFRLLRWIAPRGEIRKGLVWLAFCAIGLIPVVITVELALLLLAMAGVPVLEYLVPPSWLAFVAGIF